MSPSEQVIVQGQGYQVLQSERGFRFQRPPNAGSPVPAWLGFGLAFLGSLVSLALFGQSCENSSERADLRTGAVLMFAMAIAAFLFGRRAYRNLRADQQQAGPVLRLDENGLSNERGEALAPRAQVRLVVKIDWTDGMGGFRFCRVVSLCWAKGCIPVFRSYDQAEVKLLRQALAKFGVSGAA